MNVLVDTIDPLHDERWERLVAASPHASVFHHREWLAVLHAQYRYPIRAYCVFDQSGAIRAALPFAHVKSRFTGSRLVALPFSDLCGPLTRDGDTECVERLLATVQRDHERDSLDVEIRWPVQSIGAPSASFYYHEVPLEPGVEAVRKSFDSQVRRRISRSEREGVQVVRATSREALDQFYGLHLANRRRKGIPTQPKRFMRRLAGMFDQGLGFVLLARFEDRTIAGNVFLTFNGVLTGKYNASDPAYLKKGPNNAMLMEAIRWGCEQGYHVFDLGRTDLDNAGLRAFKLGWGAEERTLTYTRLSRAPQPEPSASSSGESVPALARLFLQRTPPITGRLVGAALYKHFG